MSPEAAPTRSSMRGRGKGMEVEKSVGGGAVLQVERP